MASKISIGPLRIPGLTIRAGLLLDIDLPGLLPHIKVPPHNITFWPEITLLPAITVFDPEWIHDILGDSTEWFGNIARGVVEGMMPWIIESVFKAVEPYLDGLAEDFYATEGEE